MVSSSAQGQGVIIPSAGPINSSMAGASTAAPVDFGASYWNPAIISGLDDQEFLLGSALALPSIHMQSSLAADSVLGQFPPTNRFGEARSDSGVASGLATGFSFRMSEDSPLTVGIGVFGLVGGGVNFPGTAGTPILSPRIPPTYFGVGPIYSNLEPDLAGEVGFQRGVSQSRRPPHRHSGEPARDVLVGHRLQGPAQPSNSNRQHARSDSDLSLTHFVAI